jgi:hypothetical protein
VLSFVHWVMRPFDWSAQDVSKKYVRVEGGTLIFLGQVSLGLFKNTDAGLYMYSCWEDSVGICLVLYHQLGDANIQCSNLLN